MATPSTSTTTSRYHDYAQEPEHHGDDMINTEHDNKTATSTNGSHCEQKFPVKLHYSFSVMHNDDDIESIIAWHAHGRCFSVHKPKEFADRILPLWFRQTKYASFQRQLNLYGFRRLTRGPDKGAYYHELFLRGKRSLAHRIGRMKVKGEGYRRASSPDDEPNLYQYPFLPKAKIISSSDSNIQRDISNRMPHQDDDDDDRDDDSSGNNDAGTLSKAPPDDNPKFSSITPSGSLVALDPRRLPQQSCLSSSSADRMSLAGFPSISIAAAAASPRHDLIQALVHHVYQRYLLERHPDAGSISNINCLPTTAATTAPATTSVCARSSSSSFPSPLPPAPVLIPPWPLSNINNTAEVYRTIVNAAAKDTPAAAAPPRRPGPDA